LLWSEAPTLPPNQTGRVGARGGCSRVIVGIESENLKTQRAQRTVAEDAEKSGSFASLRMTTFLGSAGFEIGLAGRSVWKGRAGCKGREENREKTSPQVRAVRVGQPADAAG
jgi:hypothetical protein